MHVKEMERHATVEMPTGGMLVPTRDGVGQLLMNGAQFGDARLAPGGAVSALRLSRAPNGRGQVPTRSVATVIAVATVAAGR